MSTAKQKIISKFLEVKDIWLDVTRTGDGALGNAFEDLMKVKENNRQEADYEGIEIKTQRSSTSSMITLFTQAPKNREFSNTLLRDQYGYEKRYGIKNLNSTVSVKGTFNTKANYFFYLHLDDEHELLYLKIKQSETSITDEPFLQIWDYQTFIDAVNYKLNHIAYISGSERFENDKKFVKFTQLKFITGLTKEKLIDALRNNHLKLDLRLGAYESGPSIGKFHDHGTGFRITLRNLSKYTVIEVI